MCVERNPLPYGLFREHTSGNPSLADHKIHPMRTSVSFV